MYTSEHRLSRVGELRLKINKSIDQEQGLNTNTKHLYVLTYVKDSNKAPEPTTIPLSGIELLPVSYNRKLSSGTRDK